MPTLEMKIFSPSRTQLVALAARRRAHRRDVAAGLGLGQREGADALAAHDLGEDRPRGARLRRRGGSGASRAPAPRRSSRRAARRRRAPRARRRARARRRPCRRGPTRRRPGSPGRGAARRPSSPRRGMTRCGVVERDVGVGERASHSAPSARCASSKNIGSADHDGRGAERGHRSASSGVVGARPSIERTARAREDDRASSSTHAS